MTKAQFYAYAAISVAIAILLAVWGVFAFIGMTAVQPFIAQIGVLLTIAVGALSAVGAKHLTGNKPQ